MSQAIIHQAQARRDLWQALKELDFLSAFFSWFFMLLTRLSEPFMLLSTLYVIGEAGVPVIAVPTLHNLAVGVMICAPEVILPGSFVVASKAQEQGERRANLLLTVCWLFVVLTLLTLISLFVWHFTGIGLQWLMCARCAAAVGYSILMRVMSHGQDQGKLHIEATPTTPIANSQAITIRATNASRRIHTNAVLAHWKHTLMHTDLQREREQKPTPARTSTPAGNAPITLRANANTKRKQGEQSANIEQRIRSALLSNPHLSDRELAAIANVSPSTANKWRKRIEQAA